MSPQPHPACKSLTVNAGDSLTLTILGDAERHGRWRAEGPWTPAGEKRSERARRANTLSQGHSVLIQHVYNSPTSPRLKFPRRPSRLEDSSGTRESALTSRRGCERLSRDRSHPAAQP